jgi:hypothetical protein
MTNNSTTGTPLPRYNRRVTAPPVKPTTPVVPTATVAAPPTIRTMIVCIPDGLPGEVFDHRLLDRHFGVQGTPIQRFWAKPTNLLRRRQLIHPRKGSPIPCAGGPLRLLDMVALRQAYGMAAAFRFQTWTHVVRGTRDAQPWAKFLQQHLNDPDQYPLTRAQTDFRKQPRVSAMRYHNAVVHGNGQLDEQDLEMFQTGQVAYQNYQYLTAMVGDSVLTPHGARICADTDSCEDRLTYLKKANHLLNYADEDTRIIAVLLSD